jgi:[acyl-carrier-protein] S-malonyltransferase
MGKSINERFPCARKIFQEADEILGYKLSQLMWEGPDETLRQTRYTQPAIFSVSIASYKILEERGLKPDFVAGHSLGEYSALVAAGVLEFDAALRIVRERSRLMDEAGHKIPGAMAAILGLANEKVEELCRLARGLGICEPVNFNAPEQVVIAGSIDAIQEAVMQAGTLGAKRAIRLNVSGAFHSSLMSPIAKELEAFLRPIPFKEGGCPVVTNCDAEPTRSGEELKKKLVTQIDHPVLWERSMRALAGLGADSFFEVGPGRVLTGLLKRIDRTWQGSCTEDDLAQKTTEVHS